MAKSNTANVVTDYNKSHFTDLAVRFLQGEHGLYLMPYIYSNPDDGIPYAINGSEKWEHLLKDEANYYVFKNEEHIIQSHAAEVIKIAGQKTTVVDLGPGDKTSVSKKSFPFIDKMRNTQEYYAVDFSYHYASIACETLSEKYPNIKTTPIKADFYNWSLNQRGRGIFAMLFGTTIANVPEKKGYIVPHNTIHHLARLRRLVNSEGHIAIGYDSNNDKESLLKAYDNEALHEHVMYLLHVIKWKLNITDLDVSNFECVVKWFEEDFNVAFYAYPKTTQIVRVNGERLVIPKGKILHIGNSYKFPPELFAKAATLAGFSSVKYFQDDEKRMTLHLLKAI